jgi:histidinol phosphatase-like PHP family hydrolase
MGGRFTLSDDAHAIEQVGTNYAKLFKAIIAVGIPEIAFFKKESNNSSSAVATFAVPVAELQTHPLFST